MEIFVLCLLAYFLVSPDKGSLAFSRGVAGAGYGALTGRTPKAAKGSKASPRGRAMLAGWKEGVAAARERREAGRDLWSRGTRVAGRVGGGTGSLVRGINGTIQARRGQTDDTPGTEGDPSPDAPGLDGSASPDAVPSRRGWTFPRLVRRPRTAPTSDASGLVVDQDGNDVATGDCSKCGKPALVDSDTGATYKICLDCWEKENGGATPDVAPRNDDAAEPAAEPPNTEAAVTEPEITANPEPGGEAPTPPPTVTTTTHTVPNGAIAMPTANELTNIDALDAEIKTSQNAFSDLSEAVAKYQKHVKGLPGRLSEAAWGTRGLDRTVMALAEEVGGIKLPNLESFAAVRTEIVKAREVGVAAAAAQARGRTEGFVPN